MEREKFITQYGVFATLIATIIGVGLFSYPRMMCEILGANAWWVSIIVALINYIPMVLIYYAFKKNNFEEFSVILEKNFGKIISFILNFVFATTLTLISSFSMRIFIETIKMYLLEKTPTEFLVLTIMFVGIYLIRGGISAIIKFNEICTLVMIIPAIFIMLFSINNARFTNLLPITINTPSEYLTVIKSTAIAFGGFEILYFVLPLVKNSNETKKTLKSTSVFISLFYSFFVLMCIAVFTSKETSGLLWPTVTLAKSIDIKGGFIERWDGVIMSLWILFYFSTFVNVIYLSCKMYSQCFKFGDSKVSFVIVAPLLYYATVYYSNIIEMLDKTKNLIPISNIVLGIILPILIIILSSINKKVRSE